MSFAQLFAASSVSVFILGISSIYDLVSRRVPNYLTGVAAMIGLVCPWFDICNVSVISSYLGGLVGLLLFLPPYSLNVMGAGDVKLFAVTGLYIGVEKILSLGLYVSIAGGLLAIFYLIKHETRNCIINKQLDIQKATVIQLPYAVAIFGGLLYMLFTERMT
jgi:prepilin peptidase CpaA